MKYLVFKKKNFKTRIQKEALKDRTRDRKTDKMLVFETRKIVNSNKSLPSAWARLAENPYN